MLVQLGLEPPLYLFLSLADAKGYFLAENSFRGPAKSDLRAVTFFFPR
jgi:hypothetical protein